MARVSSFKKPNFSQAQPDELPRLLTNLNSSLESVLAPILNSPLSDTILVKDITLLAGEINHVSHNYSGIPQTWLVCKSSAFTMIKESSIENKNKDKELLLETTTNCTIDLLVF